MAIIEKQYERYVVNDLGERIARAPMLNPASLNKSFADHAAALIAVEPSRKPLFLKSAIRGYEDHANEKDERCHYQRMRFAWDYVCKEMQKTGATDWRHYRRQYDNVYSQGR